MKPFTTIAFAILLAAGLLHLLRLASGFELIIAGHEIPRWANVLGAALALVVAFKLRQEARG